MSYPFPSPTESYEGMEVAGTDLEEGPDAVYESEGAGADPLGTE